jgi:hypothetical protein
MSISWETSTTDLLGRELTDDEKEMLFLYDKLKAMSAREDLPPCALMNLRQAMVMLWNVCADLDLLYEEPEVD